MQTKEPSKEYIKGFNKGYILRTHKPEIAQSLTHTKFPESSKEYHSGLLGVIEQKELELRQERSKNFSFEKLRKQYKDELSPSKNDKDKEKE